ncbi:FBD-associated F-box protein [Gossypium australe]|uniref:FBD-associated F-box protein n=1 Tax=Gossypium australe TaxID=47621 RepID=A0A5B6V655_9ROSI|nr:FBD-associated F-box protein [Gossypium australe]
METPTDLIALKTGDDRFSDLPEYIIHVLSFIGSNDIVGLSYVSRKFRQLTMCSRNLYFKLGCDSKKCTPNCKQVQGFLKGFLNKHSEPQIDRFRLHWFCRASRYDVKGSIFSLHKVQELDIGVPVIAGRAFHLPAGIESLRALKLELQGGKPKLFALVFASLETLSLSSVSVPGLEL